MLAIYGKHALVEPTRGDDRSMGDPWLRRRLYYLALSVVCVVVFIAAATSYDSVILPVIMWVSGQLRRLFGSLSVTRRLAARCCLEPELDRIARP